MATKVIENLKVQEREKSKERVENLYMLPLEMPIIRYKFFFVYTQHWVVCRAHFVVTRQIETYYISCRARTIGS